MRGRLMSAVTALTAAWPGLATPIPPAAAQPAPPDPAPTAPAPEIPDAELPAPDDAAPPAQHGVAPDDAAGEPAIHEDTELGPVIQIEAIEVLGNTATQTEIILRALPISAGDVLHASDKRLRESRFKVLALGFFRNVTLALRKGSQRGRVILEIHVVERGTLVLNRLWFGDTELSPWWLGADIGDRNLAGLGISVGGGFIFARHDDAITGSRDQYAAELRIADPSLRGSQWGASLATTLVHGSEPYLLSGQAAATTQSAFAYRRLGLRLGATYNVSGVTRLSFGARAEAIDAALPVAPTRELPDGRIVAIDLHLVPDTSHVVTASVGFDRDTRLDPILPHSGGHLALSAELGSSLLGSSYDFATLLGAYEHYWPLLQDRHAIGVKLAGGVVIGDAPEFDRIYIADVDRMLTPRALGLALSTAQPIGFLGTRTDKPTYGDLGGVAGVEYAAQMFRGTAQQRIYGGDVFVGAGVWALAERSDLRTRDTSLIDALPLDLYLDAGVRLDTDIGTFELTIANVLGRLR
jgi:hypothetical protein